MQNAKQPLNLLLCGLEAGVSEPIISLLRSARYSPRVEQAADEASLKNLIKQRHWDLMLVHQEKGLPLSQISELLKSLNKDLPVLLLTPSSEPKCMLQGLRDRASAVAAADQPEIAVMMIRRELVHLSHRRRRRQAEHFLADAEKRCRELMDSSTQAVGFIDRQGNYLYINPSYVEMLGYDSAPALSNQPFEALAAKPDQAKLKSALQEFVQSGAGDDEQPLRAQRADGTQFNLTLSLHTARFSGHQAIQVLLTSPDQDVELEALAQKDLLTGLKNQNFLAKKLAQLVEAANRGGNQAHLLYLSLDNFHHLKSELGVQAADGIVRDIATLLQSSINRAHILTRFNLDGFAILFLDDDPQRAQKLAAQLCKKVEANITQVNNAKVQTTCSIGIAPIIENQPGADEVLRQAQLAADLVNSKTQKGNGYHLFNPSENESGIEGDSVDALRRALDNDRFKLLFQPIVSLQGDNQHLYEVLLRLLDENDKEVSPNLFLTTLDHAEISLRLDRWVISESIRQLALEHKRGHQNRLFINLTGRSIADPSLLPWLSEQIKQAGLPGDSMVFQFSESDASTHLKYAKIFVDGLNQLHAQACIKHYGSGLDTQNVLKHVQAHYIKLDGSFVQELDSEEKQEAFKKLMEPLRINKKTVIAPLVEGTNVMSRLFQSGVHYIQGFYLQAPQAEMRYDYFHED